MKGDLNMSKKIKKKKKQFKRWNSAFKSKRCYSSNTVWPNRDRWRNRDRCTCAIIKKKAFLKGLLDEIQKYGFGSSLGIITDVSIITANNN